MKSQNLNSEAAVEQAIHDYILKEFMYSTDPVLSNACSLISSRILDSLKIVQLRGFLEERFHLTIYPDEVLPENFETVNAITAFVLSKLA